MSVVVYAPLVCSGVASEGSTQGHTRRRVRTRAPVGHTKAHVMTFAVLGQLPFPLRCLGAHNSSFCSRLTRTTGDRGSARDSTPGLLPLRRGDDGQATPRALILYLPFENIESLSGITILLA